MPNLLAIIFGTAHSADKGFAPAMNNLGQLYANGLGIQQDWTRAHEWSLKAADAGNPIGAMNAFIISANPDYKGTHPTNLPSSVDPGKSNATDLLEPTLERTELFGLPLNAERREAIRQAARSNVPLDITIGSLQADASVPRFERVPTQDSTWRKLWPLH